MVPKGSILIVEDNADHLELFTDAFTPDFQVIPTDSGKECLRTLAKRHCDLVILDYYLSSDFSGLEILRQIIESNPKLPVIMVTAYGNEELAVKAIKHGARDYIRKTLDNTYIDQIRRHVESILLQEKSPEPLSLDSGVKTINVLPSPEKQGNAEPEMRDFFEQNRPLFIAAWQAHMQDIRKKVGFDDTIAPSKALLEQFFTCCVTDVQNGRAVETLQALRAMVLDKSGARLSLMAAKILNMSFREVAREMFKQKYPDSYDSRLEIMNCIGVIVDENALELSKEYEKRITQISEKARQSDRLATKAALLTTLQHEVRQPLSYILNTAELLLADRTCVDDAALEELLCQTRRIETLLDRLERDSHMRTRRYSNDLNLIDLTAETE